MSKKQTPVAAAVTLGANVTLSSSTVTSVVGAINADVVTHKKWVAAADALRADGVTSQFLTDNQEARDTFKKKVILLTFTKLEQALLEKPIHALNDEQKVTRRWVQQQMGDRLSRVMKYIARAEREEEMTDEERGARRVATMGARLKKELTRWIDKIEKAEKVEFSAVEMIKALKAAQALIK